MEACITPQSSTPISSPFAGLVHHQAKEFAGSPPSTFGDEAGLYAHRHHTHPLTTGALQNGQNGQNGAKRCKTGAKRCKTVQNGCKMGAKWVQIV